MTKGKKHINITTLWAFWIGMIINRQIVQRVWQETMMLINLADFTTKAVAFLMNYPFESLIELFDFFFY